jgi:hypothetical protein
MIPPSDYLQVQQCCPSTREDKYIDAALGVEMDFDIVPYPISPTEGERHERANITRRFGEAWSNPSPSYYFRPERANITKRFGDAWSNPSPSYYFRPIDEVSTMSSEMDNDGDDLSIASNEVSSSDVNRESLWYEESFSQTAVLQESTNTDDDDGNSFVGVIGLEAEDLPDQYFKKNNE